MFFERLPPYLDFKFNKMLKLKKRGGYQIEVI